ncbi:HDOD domain-containing protein [Desulfobacula phenolica]|uniref:Probable chemoreceptor glutamine deamidase CheD n=1 Tax=Desulfobacula phenolica TaxID=90732 RepID=A0A1H2F8D5_9BACT|nr:HDOD domain-containing protein [Desulfobacula phenolica]SDU03592.1 HDIG domain-containing protein [Desulfobacula phenolica]
MNYQKIEHISAGQFKVGKEQSSIYKAYLGTCLGVALYDASTQVGGMIHILLPEPTGIASAVFSEKYASTGVPLLINHLIKLGAKPENLEATIAGGALIGPVTQQDINLDIGGRSMDIAVSILRSYKIKTIKSETGGFFTCTLELNMATGKTFINPALEDTFKSQNRFTAPSMDEILNTIDQLKPIPQIALKIFRMFQFSRHHITDITEELSKDQVLSGQTLKLCNSALFAGTVKIDTLKEAVLLLGETMLIKSVITAAVDMYYNQIGTSGYSLCKGGLFFHAVGVASFAEKIAEKSGRPLLKEAYTAGLLHDIGKVILDQFVSIRSPLFFRSLYQKNENFINAEKKLLGITHGEAGALLARKWNFSDGLSEVIQLHHTPEKAKKNKDLVYIIYLSDLLMEKFHVGFDLEKMQTQSLENALDQLGFKMADLPELVDAIPINTFSNDDDILST